MDVGGPEDNIDNEFDAQRARMSTVWLSNGRLAVIDYARVHFFDSRGNRLRITGQEGAGPEEFRFLTAICRTRGDTVVVQDDQNARFAVIDHNGNIVRTVRMPDLGSLPAEGCLGDGTLLLKRDAAGGTSTAVRVSRVRLDGSVVNTVGEFSFPPFNIVTQVTPRIIAWGQNVYVGDPTANEIRVYNPNGRLTTIIRTADRLTPISRSDIEKTLSDMGRNLSPEVLSQRVAQIRATARTWPGYLGLDVDPLGRLWVEDFSRNPNELKGWTAFAPDGRLIGRVIIPTIPGLPVVVSHAVKAFGADRVILLRPDSDGFKHLVVYPLEQIRR